MISIFPNPVDNYINFDSYEGQIENVQVYSLTGQLVFETEITVNGLDVLNFSAGQYTVRLYSENGNYSARIIKE